MIEAQIENFVKQTIRELESYLSKKKKNIVVIAYYATYRSQFGDLIARLKEKYNVITVVDRILNDAFEKSGHHNVLFPWRVVSEQGETYYLNADIKGIDLILTADQVSYEEGRIDREFLSKSAKRIYFPHSLIEPTGASDVFDYICVPSKLAKKGYEKSLKGKKTKLLESGYPKFDKALRNYRYTPQNTITYAPTLRYVSNRRADINLYAGFDNHMIEGLLRHTDFHISYRAHPINFQGQHFFYTLIKKKWEQESRVSFDEQLGNDFCNWSDFLVTDTSTTALTYSFVTGKPSFFYNPHPANNILTQSVVALFGGGGLYAAF